MLLHESSKNIWLRPATDVFWLLSSWNIEIFPLPPPKKKTKSESRARLYSKHENVIDIKQF